jgi:hypothetical protein
LLIWFSSLRVAKDILIKSLKLVSANENPRTEHRAG